MKKARKLVLNRETLGTLTTGHLERVGAGATGTCSAPCTGTCGTTGFCTGTCAGTNNSCEICHTE